MVSFDKKTILQIGNILTPIVCFSILSLLSIGQGDYNQIFQPAGNESLIDPIDFAFAIWGPIFLFLFIFLVYQARDLFKSPDEKRDMEFVEQVSVYFMLSTVMTTFWYVFWLYRIIWAATTFMILYLISLVAGYMRLKINLIERSTIEKVAIIIPWSMYTAWVTTATIVSITTFFVSIGFNDPAFLIPDAYWAVIVLLVALIIYTAVLLTRDDYIFAGVGIWALLGILFKRVFASELVLEVIITVIIGIFVLLVAILYQAVTKD